jgi:3-methyl-2-oxobutanoate hydroxymethyltransferase
MTADTRPDSIPDLVAMKAAGRPIVMLTCYDATFGRLLDRSGIDVILVGDSVNQVVAGHDSTLGATLEQLIYHASAVRRGVPTLPIVVDLPFMTYQVSVEEAIRNAGRVLQRSGCNAVKLEGGAAMAPTVRALVERGIPVVGHLGLTPQSVNVMGGYRVQGRDQDDAARMLEDARALEASGASLLVLELVPTVLATRISEALRIPTVGIGAGSGCDGQVLVLHDMLGLNEGFNPKFLRKFADLAGPVQDAVRAYAADVRARRYPGPEHSFE